jgi:phosphopantothenoylcysteine decarboxylase/phosphopantothenate--cysteine ligase
METDLLSGKKILLGVTGCIAAYKSCLLVRELILRGAEVKVVMTPSAHHFITPLTLSTLSRNPVITEIFPKDSSQQNTWHIETALWADVMLIAPCTINTIAKIANGFADNALTTLVTAMRGEVIISPAADVDMYEYPITKSNITKLTEIGFHFIDADSGELASGLEGKGRLPELQKIIDSLETVLSGYKKDLTGKKILVTAGPTYEDIDPVRYIGNRSSGKMGLKIAHAAYLRGADVTLISGPTQLSSYQGINRINVRSASEMKNSVSSEFEKNDVLIMSAAVADYKPENKSSSKIKKEDSSISISLTKTDDILSSLNKGNKIVVGFALETDNEVINAEKKLKSKNLDLIVLNSLKESGSGFEVDTNKVVIIGKDKSKIELPLMSKFQTAHKIIDELLKLYKL